MKEVWHFVSEHAICVEDDLPGLSLLRQHNVLLMEVFADMGLSNSDLYKVNICRLHLQVLTIADITDGCGERITWNAWQGQLALPHTPQYKWGLQPRPPESFWVIWQRVITRLCGRDRLLLQPLGHWTGEGCKCWIWWYDECTESLFQQTEEASFRYIEKSARNTRRANWRYNESVHTLADVPMSVTP
jgi:hypothetical protein